MESPDPAVDEQEQQEEQEEEAGIADDATEDGTEEEEEEESELTGSQVTVTDAGQPAEEEEMDGEEEQYDEEEQYGEEEQDGEEEEQGGEDEEQLDGEEEQYGEEEQDGEELQQDGEEEEQEDKDPQSSGSHHSQHEATPGAQADMSPEEAAAFASDAEGSPVDDIHEGGFELQDDEQLVVDMGPFDAGDHALQGAEDFTDYETTPATDGPTDSGTTEPRSSDSVEASRREHRPGAAVGTRGEHAYDADADTEARVSSDTIPQKTPSKVGPAGGKKVLLSVSGSQVKSAGEKEGGEDVFQWLRRVSTQMDESGITDQLKAKYGDKPQVICENPSSGSDPAEVSEVPSITLTDATPSASQRHSRTQTVATPPDQEQTASPPAPKPPAGPGPDQWQSRDSSQDQWQDRDGRQGGGAEQDRWADRGSSQGRPPDCDRPGYRGQQQQQQQQYGQRYNDSGYSRDTDSRGGPLRDPRCDRAHSHGYDERGGGSWDVWDSEEVRSSYVAWGPHSTADGGGPEEWSEEWYSSLDGGAAGETDQGQPCGQCRCCQAMLRAVTGQASEPPPHAEPPPPQEQDGELSLSSQQQESLMDQLRDECSAEDLLDAELSSMTVSTGTANSCDDERERRPTQRVRDPRRWIKSVTDDFLRTQNIRELVLKNDCVEPGRVRSKMTRVMRCQPKSPPPPEPRKDCAAGARGDRGHRRKERRSPGRAVKGAWSPCRPARRACTQRPVTAPCGGGGRPRLAVSPIRLSTRLMDGRELSHCAGNAASAVNPTRQFIETYLERTGQNGSGKRKGAGRGKRSAGKTKRLITISTNLKS